MMLNSLVNITAVIYKIILSSFRYVCSRNDGVFTDLYKLFFYAKHSISIAVLFSLLLASSFSLAASAQKTSLQSLLVEGHLTISQRLIPENPVKGQEVTLEIQISTDRWFAGGTRLKPVLTDDVLVLQRQALATNSSEQEQGKTWVVQLWELSLFPQEEGALFSPAIDVSLKINTESGIVEGSYQLESSLMQVSVPAEVTDIKSWLPAKNFSIKSSLSKPLDNIQRGDAFTQTIEFRADNTLAMMLPETKTPAIDGLGIYQQAPQLKNNSNRGAKEAIRTETINFVAEKTGNYELPSQTFYWWDTDSNSLQEETLEAFSFSVGGTAVTVNTGKALNYTAFIIEQSRFAAAIVAFIILILIYRFWKKLRGNISSSIPSARKLQKNISQAISKNDWQSALRWAYLWMDNYSTHSTTLPLRQYLSNIKESSDSNNEERDELEKLFENAFSKHDVKSSNFSLTMFKQSPKHKAQIVDDPLRINP